jgi:predicted nucleotidyltransferase
MASSVVEAFNEFHNRITPTSEQRARVASRASRAETYLRKFFGPDHDLAISKVSLMGSAARRTQIRPLTDLDILAEFRNKDQVFEMYRGDSQAFLQRIQRTLDARTQIARIGVRGQAVRLFYQDGLHVDIAPVFAWSGGGYGLPSGDGSWITTDPFRQQEWANQKEKQLSGLYKRRVRMLKRWNDEHSRRLDSYHLEVMVGTAFSSMSKDSRKGLRRFFEWAPSYLHVQDPAGHSGDLANGLTYLQEQAIRESFGAAEDRARRANEAELEDDQMEAIRLWRIILGEEFPAYG